MSRFACTLRIEDRLTEGRVALVEGELHVAIAVLWYGALNGMILCCR